MLQKLYGNSGLVLLAVVCAGVWASNVHDFLSVRNAPKPTLEELLERAAHNPQALTSEDRIRIGKHEQAQASPTPTSAFKELLEQDSRREQQRLRAAPTPGKYDDFTAWRRATATALCADGTYSYSASRRRTCSGHGGVKEWLR